MMSKPDYTLLSRTQRYFLRFLSLVYCTHMLRLAFRVSVYYSALCLLDLEPHLMNALLHTSQGKRLIVVRRACVPHFL